MHKYDPLGTYLKSGKFETLSMTFAEIERLIDGSLPASARKHRAWWSNNPSNSVITKAWLDAGYVTANVDLAAERLTFRKAHRDQTVQTVKAAPPAASIFGCMKGTLTVLSEGDLVHPADGEWGKVYEDV